MLAVGQIPGLNDKADGSLVARRRHELVGSSADRPVVHRRRRQPASRSTSSPGRRRPARLRPDVDRGQQPGPGERRRHPARPGRTRTTPARRACSPRSAPAASPSASWRAWTAAARTAPPTGSARSWPCSTADGLTGPVTRVVSVNQACPATPFLTTYEASPCECATPGEDYSGGVITPIRGDAPADAGRARPTRSPPAAAAWTRTSARRTPHCRPAGGPRTRRGPGRGHATDRRAHRPAASSASWASRRSTCWS